MDRKEREKTPASTENLLSAHTHTTHTEKIGRERWQAQQIAWQALRCQSIGNTTVVVDLQRVHSEQAHSEQKRSAFFNSDFHTVKWTSPPFCVLDCVLDCVCVCGRIAFSRPLVREHCILHCMFWPCVSLSLPHSVIHTRGSPLGSHMSLSYENCSYEKVHTKALI